MDKAKFEAIKAYLLSEGNYDFPFNKYCESVKMATGKAPFHWVMFREYFFDDPILQDETERLSYERFAKLIKSSPDFNPDDPFFWFADGQLHSAKHIYPDIYDVDKVAAWCVEHNDDLDYDEDIHKILFEEVGD